MKVLGKGVCGWSIVVPAAPVVVGCLSATVAKTPPPPLLILPAFPLPRVHPQPRSHPGRRSLQSIASAGPGGAPVLSPLVHRRPAPAPAPSVPTLSIEDVRREVQGGPHLALDPAIGHLARMRQTGVTLMDLQRFGLHARADLKGTLLSASSFLARELPIRASPAFPFLCMPARCTLRARAFVPCHACFDKPFM